jgi:hypothetical protein
VVVAVSGQRDETTRSLAPLANLPKLDRRRLCWQFQSFPSVQLLPSREVFGHHTRCNN